MDHLSSREYLYIFGISCILLTALGDFASIHYFKYKYVYIEYITLAELPGVARGKFEKQF